MKTIFSNVALFALLSVAVFAMETPDLLTLEARAHRGDAEAQNLLGERYLTGDGVPKDLHKAMRLFLMASDQGHPQAPYHLGKIFLTGDGVKRNQTQACRWYQVAAERGEALSKQNLWVCKTRGLQASQSDFR